jgi:hypothetical protein
MEGDIFILRKATVQVSKGCASLRQAMMQGINGVCGVRTESGVPTPAPASLSCGPTRAPVIPGGCIAPGIADCGGRHRAAHRVGRTSDCERTASRWSAHAALGAHRAHRNFFP